MEQIEKNTIHSELCDEKQSGILNMDAVIAAENTVSNEKSRKTRIRVLYADQYENDYQQTWFVWFELFGVGRVFAIDNTDFYFSSWPQNVDAEFAICDQCGMEDFVYCEEGFYALLQGNIDCDNHGNQYVENETTHIRISSSEKCEEHMCMPENPKLYEGYLCIEEMEVCEDTKQKESISLKNAADHYVKVSIFRYNIGNLDSWIYDMIDNPDRITFDVLWNRMMSVTSSSFFDGDHLNVYELVKCINQNNEVGIRIRIYSKSICSISLDEFFKTVLQEHDSCDGLKVGVLKKENEDFYLEGIFSTCKVFLSGKQDIQELERLIDEFVLIDGQIYIEYVSVD